MKIIHPKPTIKAIGPIFYLRSNKVINTLFFLSLLIGLYSCTKDSGSQNSQGKLIHVSACKLNKSSNQGNEIPDSLSCAQFNYAASSGTLTIKHINAGFNCCPDKIDCHIIVRNDSILISETESAAACNCNCLYDLDIQLTNLTSGSYTIHFIEPYAGDQPALTFGIDLATETEGEYCVIRKQYPWGLGI